MKILHIAAHLGGGVGKAHSALCAVDAPDIRRHYLLLEAPRDSRYVDLVRQSGAQISVARDAAEIRQLAAEADIVQIEWWNHPRLYECLARFNLPATRTVIWSHISGLFSPYLPAALYAAPHRFLFTSACSMDAPHVQALAQEDHERLGVVNSGFGFDNAMPEDWPRRARTVAYLGTVHFSKLDPAFFEVIDQVALDRPVSMWGGFEEDGEVARCATGMRHPERVRFHGHTDNPEAMLAKTGILLYLLQPKHFGTAENVLVEAMSLGCVPLVFANPAESAIVEHGRTGFIETSAAAAARRLAWMLDNPAITQEIGREAASTVATGRSPAKSAADFAAIYRSVLSHDKRKIDFGQILGTTPAEWFLSTQGEISTVTNTAGDARKGSFAHFSSCFPEDGSLKDFGIRFTKAFSLSSHTIGPTQALTAIFSENKET